MNDSVSSYVGLFRDDHIASVEIPLIQRDFAQGREGVAVQDIRDGFLEFLADAIEGDAPRNLDFIYGDTSNGVFRPLDGQQRLTTLFLIHWYAACRTDRIDTPADWNRFTYATRPSARMFCERLTDPDAMAGVEPRSGWLTNRPWFAFDWHQDPTIKAMLVMIDAIAERFSSVDPHLIWDRLTRADDPVITFHRLQITEAHQGDDLYIKMNSRGKPLTPFENFKARFESTIEHTGDLAKEFAHRVDVEWSDMLWPHRGDDDIVDDEFMRYLGYLVEICEWREERIIAGPLGSRAHALFGPSAPRSQEHLRYLFAAFDAWLDTDIDAFFASTFGRPGAVRDGSGERPVPLFGRDAQVNLFSACCREYGELRHSTARAFSLQQGILLYAVLVHRIHSTDNHLTRLRALRNIVEWSADEIRLTNMPAILNEVDSLMIEGNLDAIKTLNQAQVADELAKAKFIASAPELRSAVHDLEDHEMMRGALTSFELTNDRFAARASAFDAIFSDESLWDDASGALISIGEYQRTVPNSTKSLFGTSAAGQTRFWRDVFSGGRRERVDSTRAALMELLDRVDHNDATPRDTMRAMRTSWLSQREQSRQLDWRYYFARYPIMRSGTSGIYVRHGEQIGYNIRMLLKTQLNSLYRDPYLLAIWDEAGRPDNVEDPWFRGSEPERWMKFRRRSAEIRCVEPGWAVRLRVAGQTSGPAFLEVMRSFGWERSDDFEGVVPIHQLEIDGVLVDRDDRIEIGRKLVERLLAAGF